MRVSVEQEAPDVLPWAGSWKFGYAVLLAFPTMKRPHEMFGDAEATLALSESHQAADSYETTP